VCGDAVGFDTGFTTGFSTSLSGCSALKTTLARPGITDPGHRGKLIVLVSVATLAVMALMVYLIWSGYREAIRNAETTSRNYAAIIEARLDATLRRTDADLQELARTIPVAALSKQAVPRYAREVGADWIIT